MSRKLLLSLLVIISNAFVFAQRIKGNLSLLKNQEIKLEGFNGTKTYLINTTTIDEKGDFELNYSKADFGIGYLMSVDKKAFFVILSGENVEIIGEALNYTETIKVTKGVENQLFEKYAIEYPLREKALKAWEYLEKLYNSDSFFSIQNTPKYAIQREIKRIEKEDSSFLAQLPKDTYVSWFLPIRKLVSSVSTVTQSNNETLKTIKKIRKLDYTDQRLYKSGLFKEAIESHFWLLENSGRSLDSIFIEMKTSIDSMMEDLIKDEKKLNEVTNYLFDLLERHSLFQASEYLAIKVLNETSCTIEPDLANQLESYRAMKIGNIAPDINFDGDNFAPNLDSIPKGLIDFDSKYTVVVFGASWCPKCVEEIPEIVKLYQKWKEQGVEVIFVSLDENKEDYKGFVKNFPFFSTCDYKKWESKTVNDYYVFGTPTMYLLDNKREIILRPNSVKQMDEWVDWYLVEKDN